MGKAVSIKIGDEDDDGVEVLGPDEDDPDAVYRSLSGVVGQEDAEDALIDYLDGLGLTGEEGDLVVELCEVGRGRTDPVWSGTFRGGGKVSAQDLAAEIVDRAIALGRRYGATKARFRVRIPKMGGRSFALTYPGGREAGELAEARALAHGREEKYLGAILDLVKINVASSAQIIRDQRLELQDRRKHDIERENQWRDLVRAEDERKLNLLRANREEDRKDQVGGMLITGGQVLMQQLTGKKLFDQESTVLEQTLFALFAGMDRDQLQNLTRVFSRPDQVAALQQIFQVLNERMERGKVQQQQQQQAAHANGHANGAGQ